MLMKSVKTNHKSKPRLDEPRENFKKEEKSKPKQTRKEKQFLGKMNWNIEKIAVLLYYYIVLLLYLCCV